MFEIIARIMIRRPAEEIFSFIADNENDPKWCIPVVETQRIAGAAPGRGARYRYVSQMGPFQFGGEFEITEFDPPNRIAWTGETPVGLFTGYYRLKGEGDSTILTEAAQVRPKGIMTLLQAVMRPQMAAAYNSQLKTLKQIMEAGLD